MRVNLISSSPFNAVCFSFQVGLIRNFVNDQGYASMRDNLFATERILNVTVVVLILVKIKNMV